MTKLSEHRKNLEATEYLVNQMIHEIDLLRNIVARYHAKYGEQVQTGEMNVEDGTSFDLRTREGDVLCEIYNAEQVGIESRYQQIKREVKRLV